MAKAQRTNGTSNTKMKHLKQLTAEEFQNTTAHNVNKDNTENTTTRSRASARLQASKTTKS